MKLPDIKVELIPPWAWALMAGAGVYLAWKLKEKGIAGVTAGVVGGTAGVVADVASGTVKGLGQVVGIPDTDGSECASAMAEGRTWAASLYCPAATFARYLVTPKTAAKVTTKPAGVVSGKSVGGVKLDGTLDLSSVTGVGASFEDLSKPYTPIFSLDTWITQKNGASYGKQIVETAGLRG